MAKQSRTRFLSVVTFPVEGSPVVEAIDLHPSVDGTYQKAYNRIFGGETNRLLQPLVIDRAEWKALAWMDEEGLLRKQPVNFPATDFVFKGAIPFQPLVGPVVVFLPLEVADARLALQS